MDDADCSLLPGHGQAPAELSTGRPLSVHAGVPQRGKVDETCGRALPWTGAAASRSDGEGSRVVPVMRTGVGAMKLRNVRPAERLDRLDFSRRSQYLNHE